MKQEIHVARGLFPCPFEGVGINSERGAHGGMAEHLSHTFTGTPSANRSDAALRPGSSLPRPSKAPRVIWGPFLFAICAMHSRWVWLVPSLWVVASITGWVITLGLLESHGNLDTDAALSAAQVFTGIAGFGAGVVALIALERQLRPPRALLSADVGFEGDRRLRIRVRNSGPVAAEDVTIRFEGGHNIAALGGIAGWSSHHPADQFVYFLRNSPIPAFSEFISVSPGQLEYEPSLTAVVLTCSNGTGQRPPVPRLP